MRRRDFVAALGGAAVLPLAARAQQADRPVIGLLATGTPSGWNLSGYRQGFKDAGFVEGQNLAIEYRFANDDPARLPELAADLVRRRVRVIVAVARSLAARQRTRPILFRSFSVMAPIRSNRDLSQVSTGRAVT